jgi:hypothetical protein
MLEERKNVIFMMLKKFQIHFGDSEDGRGQRSPGVNAINPFQTLFGRHHQRRKIVPSRVTRLGHFFAHWAIENFGKFFENKNSKKKKHKFLGHFHHGTKLCFNFDQNGFCYILGDFFPNSSGHTGHDAFEYSWRSLIYEPLCHNPPPQICFNTVWHLPLEQSQYYDHFF